MQNIGITIHNMISLTRCRYTQCVDCIIPCMRRRVQSGTGSRLPAPPPPPPPGILIIITPLQTPCNVATSTPDTKIDTLYCDMCPLCLCVDNARYCISGGAAVDRMQLHDFKEYQNRIDNNNER